MKDLFPRPHRLAASPPTPRPQVGITSPRRTPGAHQATVVTVCGPYVPPCPSVDCRSLRERAATYRLPRAASAMPGSPADHISSLSSVVHMMISLGNTRCIHARGCARACLTCMHALVHACVASVHIYTTALRARSRQRHSFQQHSLRNLNLRGTHCTCNLPPSDNRYLSTPITGQREVLGGAISGCTAAGMDALLPPFGRQCVKP